jgi:hypothetical protein
MNNINILSGKAKEKAKQEKNKGNKSFLVIINTVIMNINSCL